MAKLVGPELKNMPWEDAPASHYLPIWRYSANPIITRDDAKYANSIFNSAAVPHEGKFAGVFRVDSMTRQMRLRPGFSEDGYKWHIADDEIEFKRSDPEVEAPEYSYDPRVVWIEDRYWIIWCNGWHGPTIGIGYTFDFKEFHLLENALLPYNRNGVLFPRKINGKYMLLSRPSDTGHTAFGDIYLSQSEDMIHWGRHRYVMGPQQPWESTKIGGGPVPIETSEGWLMFHHGVLTSCNGYVYSFGATLLDLEQPWKVIRRGSRYLINPQTQYEIAGDVPNVCFPCATLTDAATGRITIYYGAADTVTALAFTTLEGVLDWIKK